MHGLNEGGYRACLGYGYVEAECKENYGYGPGSAVIILGWYAGVVGLSALWQLTRPRQRMCATCGSEIPAGPTACSACGEERPSRGSLVAVIAVVAALLTLALSFTQIVVTDGNSCFSDVVWTSLGDRISLIGSIGVGALTFAAIVSAAPVRLRQFHAHWGLGVLGGLVAFLAVLIATEALPHLGLVPGIECR